MINQAGLVPQQQAPDPSLFQNLMNLIGGNRELLGKAARYGPGAAVAAGELAQGDLMGAVGAGAGAFAAGQAMKGLAGAIPAVGLPGMLAKGALYAGGSLLGSSLGSQLGSGVGALGNQLIGGTQNAVREAGTAAGTGKEAGLGGMSQQEINNIRMLKEMGVNMPAEALERGFQITNKMKDRDVGRQMQMNQQLAGLTAQLQRNLGGMQLAGQAMSGATALTSQMLTSNPYQSSVLQTGGIRGPMG